MNDKFLSIYGSGLALIGGIIATMISITLIPLMAIILIFAVLAVFVLIFGVIGAILIKIGAPTLGTSLIGLVTFGVDLAAWMSVAGVGIFAFLFGNLYNVATSTAMFIINFASSLVNFLGEQVGLVKQTGYNPYNGLPTSTGLPTDWKIAPINTANWISGYQSFVDGVISSLRQLGLVQPCPTGQNCTS